MCVACSEALLQMHHHQSNQRNLTILQIRLHLATKKENAGCSRDEPHTKNTKSSIESVLLLHFSTWLKLATMFCIFCNLDSSRLPLKNCFSSKSGKNHGTELSLGNFLTGLQKCDTCAAITKRCLLCFECPNRDLQVGDLDCTI